MSCPDACGHHPSQRLLEWRPLTRGGHCPQVGPDLLDPLPRAADQEPALAPSCVAGNEVSLPGLARF